MVGKTSHYGGNPHMQHAEDAGPIQVLAVVTEGELKLRHRGPVTLVVLVAGGDVNVGVNVWSFVILVQRKPSF